MTHRKPVGAVRASQTRAWYRIGHFGHGHASFELSISQKMLAMIWFAWLQASEKRLLSSGMLQHPSIDCSRVGERTGEGGAICPRLAQILRQPCQLPSRPQLLRCFLAQPRAFLGRGAFKTRRCCQVNISQHYAFNMAEPPRDPTDHNMSPPRPPRSVHPGQSPAPLQSRSPSIAPNRSQVPPTAVPWYRMNPATGQQGQHVSAASYEMGK